uniref:Uncharacterized protein n=1 Tax=viral metagenome TaxID=1070528 RepID=A0A6M3KGJ4_9ZZZZ
MGLFDNISSAWDNLTWQSSAQKTTGAVGGSTNAQSPGFNISGIISDWTSSISTAWDSLFKQTPTSQAQSNYYNTPYVAPQVTPQQLQTTNWGGVSSTPAVPNVALPSPSIQYTPQVTKPAWEGAGLNAQPFFAPQPAYAQDTNQPTQPYQPSGGGFWWEGGTVMGPPTAEQYSTPQYQESYISQAVKTDPSAVTKHLSSLANVNPTTKEYIIDDKTAQSQIDASAKYVQNEKDVLNLINTAGGRGLTLPNISGDKLDLIQNEGSIKQMWDMGYKVPKLLASAMEGINQVNAQYGNIADVPEADLSQLDYKSIVNMMTFLTTLTPNDLKGIQDLNKTLEYTKTIAGTDAFGNRIYNASEFKFVEPYKTTAQKETEAKAKSQTAKAEAEAEATAKYWSPSEVADRNRSRQENADWSEARQMEGWSGFYKVFDLLQLSPNMDEYFNSPDMFAELRRQWKAKGGGTSWEQWLAQYDFKKEFNKLTPSQRGERPQVFAPRMRSVS